MARPQRIRVNTRLPFPSLVTGSGPVTINKQNGIWSVGLAFENLAPQAPPSGNFPTDYVLVWDSVAGDYFRMPLSAVAAAAAGIGTSPPNSTTAVGTLGQMEIDQTNGALWVCLDTNKWQSFKGSFNQFNSTPQPYVIDLTDEPFRSLVLENAIDLGGGVFEDDWGPALNAASAYILANGQIGTIVLPNHNISFIGTWQIGDTQGTGPGTGTPVTINIEGAGANAQLIFRGMPGGVTNGTAIWIAVNKRSRFRNVFLSNGAAIGTTTALCIGGSVHGIGATDTTGFHFLMCGWAGFQTCVNDSTLGAGAASEGTFENCWFVGPSAVPPVSGTVGARPDQFNSTNWTFINCYFSDLERAIDTGGSSLINVFGGGSTGNLYDFYCEGRCRITINGWRNEAIAVDGAVIIGNAGQVAGHNIRVNNVAASGAHNVVQGSFRQFALYDSSLEGYVSVDFTNNVTFLMVNNMVWPDPTTGFPFHNSSVSGAFPGHIFCKNNSYPTDVYDQTPSASRISVADIDGFPVNNDFNDFYVDITNYLFKQGTPDGLFAGNIDVDGVDWQGLYRVRCLSEAPMPSVMSSSNTPVSGLNLRVMGTFAGANSLAITFKRTISVTAGSGGITQAGTFFKSDVGKRVFIAAGGNPSGDFYGTIVSLGAANARANLVVSQAKHLPNFAGSKNAVVGQDEPNANYMVVVTGNVNETFWVDTITSTGFTVHSSNAASTATVTCLIIR